MELIERTSLLLALVVVLVGLLGKYLGGGVYIDGNMGCSVGNGTSSMFVILGFCLGWTAGSYLKFFGCCHVVQHVVLN